MSAQWKNACVAPDCRIIDALRVINQSSTRAAFVVKEGGFFCGMVTDGDIRRGLLASVALEAPVEKVMNRAPLTCTPEDSAESVLRIMEFKQLLHMPVVEDGLLVNVLSLQDLIKQPERENPVVIMAGGYGTRLRPLTEACPKPLLKVGNKPILERILESFIDSGFCRFYISTHYLPHMIEEYFGDGSRWGVSISYTYEKEALGTAGALGLLPEDIPQLPLIMINGDILTQVDFGNLLDYHSQTQGIATMCVREHEYQIPYGVIRSSGFKVSKLIEKPIFKYHVNAGIYVVDHQLVKEVEQGKYIDMPTLLNEQVEQGRQVSIYPLDEHWRDIGRLDDFELAQDDIGIHRYD